MTKEERARALNWLYEEGNPVLRLWAAERLGAAGDELAALRGEMLNHPDVQYWLGCLKTFSEKPMLHGSFDRCLENCMRKLLLFGVRESDHPDLGRLNNSLLERLEHHLDHPGLVNPVDYTILASYLAAMGRGEQAVADTILERLEFAAEFEALGGCDMYADPAGYPKIPEARRSHPLVHPRYYEGNRYRYPLVYDLLAWARLPKSAAGHEDVQKKLGSVMRTVLSERYQRLPQGYGLLFIPPNRYYGMGWSVHLPGFFVEKGEAFRGSPVWWAEALSPFPEVSRSDWYVRTMEKLEACRTEDGFWKFPAAFLPEASDKYAVGGGHMGLGESRKKAASLKLESTAWLLRILENTLTTS